VMRKGQIHAFLVGRHTLHSFFQNHNDILDISPKAYQFSSEERKFREQIVTFLRSVNTI
jgi:hypothetical protein